MIISTVILIIVVILSISYLVLNEVNNYKFRLAAFLLNMLSLFFLFIMTWGTGYREGVATNEAKRIKKPNESLQISNPDVIMRNDSIFINYTITKELYETIK